MITVLADCPNCNREVEAKIFECDQCLEAVADFETRHGPQDRDPMDTQHIECTVCGDRIW